MGAKFILEGSGAGAVKAVEDLNNALKATEKGSEGAARSTKRLSDEARRLAENADPQLKYNNQIQRLSEHVAAGRIQLEAANKVAAKYGQELFQVSEQGKKAAAAAQLAGEQAKRRGESESKSLAIILEAGRKNLQLLKERDSAAAAAAAKEKLLVDAAAKIRESLDPQQKLNRLYQELGPLVKAGKLSIEEATAAGVKYRKELLGVPPVVDSTAVQLAKMAMAAGIAAAAVATIKRGFDEAEKAAQGAADATFGAIGAAGELQQLGPEAFARGSVTARKLKGLGVVQNLTQGLDIATNLENAGFSSREIDFLVDELAAKRVVKPENFQTTGGALKKIMTAFPEAGDIRAVVDKAIKVSTIPGVQTGITKTLEETLKFVPFFKEAGFSLDQSLAAFAGVEPVSPSEDFASEALKSFGAQIVKQGLAKDGDLFATIANVRSKVGKGNAFDVLKEQNAVVGFQLLESQLANVRSAESQLIGAGGTLKSVSGEMMKDPLLAAAVAKATEEGRLADARDRAGEKESLFDAAAAVKARGLEERFGGFGSAIAGIGAPVIDVLGLENIIIKQVAERTSGAMPTLENAQLMNDYLKRIAESNERIEKRDRGRATTRQE